MLKSSFFEGSSTENEKVLKVTKIQKVDLDTYFYIKLSNVVEFKDFEEFILEYNNLEAPVISSVNTETPENQIWVSQILANSLSLKIGDLVKLKQAYAVKTVKKVDIVIENSTAQALSLELQRALKALLTFCYTPKTLKFDFKGMPWGNHRVRHQVQGKVKTESVGVPVAYRQLFLKDYMPKCCCKTVRLHEL